MASNIRNTVEPAFGWLFVVVVIVALAGAFLSATTPRTEVAGPIDIDRRSHRH